MTTWPSRSIRAVVLDAAEMAASEREVVATAPLGHPPATDVALRAALPPVVTSVEDELLARLASIADLDPAAGLRLVRGKFASYRRILAFC